MTDEANVETIHTKLTKRACAVNDDGLQKCLQQECHGSPSQVQVVRKSKLSRELKQQIWDLLQCNMKEWWMKSSLNLDALDKQKETFHKDARFVVIYRETEMAKRCSTKSVSSNRNNPPRRTVKELSTPPSIKQDNLCVDQSDTLTRGQPEGLEGKIVAGFACFRFEGDRDLEERIQSVLYCYEVQVHSEDQGRGLGQRLLTYLRILAEHYKMQKIMLTVLKENERAYKFYEKSGFTVDETSPEDSENKDYVIVSRELLQ